MDLKIMDPKWEVKSTIMLTNPNYDEQFFDTIDEAKEYFMDNCIVAIRLNACLNWGDQELYISSADLGFGPDEDDEYDELMGEWEDYVDNLMDDLNIDYSSGSRERTMQGVFYTFYGTPNSLIKFMERYTEHLDYLDGSAGEQFYDTKKQFIEYIDNLFKLPVHKGFFK